MASTTKQIPKSTRAMKDRVGRALPHFAAAELADLARIIGALLRTFQPESIYVFGSQARETPSRHSDVDILVVVADAGEYPHHLAQEAYRVVGHHLLPLDIVFTSQKEFEWRSRVVTSLPATVLREGKLLYAAGTA